MKKLTPQLCNPRANYRIDYRLVAPSAISFVADDRMFQPGQMHANLMRASCLQLDVKQCKPFKSPPNFVNRERGTSAAHHGHARAIARVARDRLIDFAAFLFNQTMDERDIRLENFAISKLIGEMFVRVFGFRHNEQTRRSLVQAMHNSRSRRAARSRQLL